MNSNFERQFVGAEGEHEVALKLLSYRAEVYRPVVDVGTDLVVRTRSGTYKRVQVKKVATERDPRWFQVKGLEAAADLYVVGITAGGEFWIFPSRIFATNCTVSAGGEHDLDLDKVPRLGSRTRGELLAQYQAAWGLLTE